MAFALHDPVAGYYARRISTVGRGGDFTTTAEISPALAKAVAAWLVRELRTSGCRDVIELGPGSGALAAAVRSEMPWYWRWRTRIHLVETSATLRAVQAKHRELAHARWHETVESALDACQGSACLYSNEFFDAFPVRLFQNTASRWQELHLRRAGESWQEVMRDPDELPDSSVWQRTWPEGQRVEVHASVREWWQNMARHWRDGSMLTIDYGAPLEKLYHRQPAGSLRAYLLQQRLSGEAVYRNVGRQDITADVNFTDMIRWTEAFAESRALQSQREFLLPFATNSHPGDACAVDPFGAGDAFCVWDCRVKK